jgi:plasmid stabilization system protein ParE
MRLFRLSPEAAQDIIDIYEFIAQNNVDAAEEARRQMPQTAMRSPR